MRVVERICRLLLGTAMIVMTGGVFLGVFFRYVINEPLLWSDEVATSALAWLTFIGGALLYGQTQGHLNLTFATDRMRPPLRRLVVVTISALELILLAVIFVGSLIFLHYNQEAVTSALELPVYVVFGVVPVTTTVAILFLARRIAGEIRGTRQTEHREHA